MRLVPGLLQTASYTRAVNQVPGCNLSGDELDRLVQMRMRRQEILDRQPPPKMHMTIDEAVLYRRIGDRQTMHEQLCALTMPRGAVTIQVLPFSTGAHDSVGGPLLILQLPDEPDVAYADGWARGQLIDTPAEVLRAQQTFQQLAALALPPDMSAELINAYAEEL